MHILLIIVILMLAFPVFARAVGSFLSIMFWLVIAALVLGMIGAFSH